MNTDHLPFIKTFKPLDKLPRHLTHQNKTHICFYHLLNCDGGDCWEQISIPAKIFKREEGLYGKSFFVCSLVTTSLSSDRQATTLANVSQVPCPDRVHDLSLLGKLGGESPSGLLSFVDLGSLRYPVESHDSYCFCLADSGGPPLSCFTDAPGSSSEISMLSGSDSSELSYSTRRSPLPKLTPSTRGITHVGWTQALDSTCSGSSLKVSAGLSPPHKRVSDSCSETWQCDSVSLSHAAVKPCQSALRYLRYRTKYSRKQVSEEMRKSRRVLWSKETLRSSSRKWQWGLQPEEQAASSSAKSSNPEQSLQGETSSSVSSFSKRVEMISPIDASSLIRSRNTSALRMLS